MGALSFTSPLLLTALLSLPLIWWLLRATPPTPQQKPFPPFLILRQLQNDRETPHRSPWWMLLLRLLLAAVVIIALAGPILNAPPKTPATGPMVIMIDDTFAAAHHWRTRRQAMLAAVAEAEQNDRALYLLPTAPSRQEASIAPMTPDEAREAITRLSPKAWPADRARAVEQLKEATLPSSPEIRWLSDGVAGDNDLSIYNALDEIGSPSLLVDRAAPKPVLYADGNGDKGPRYVVRRLRTDSNWEGMLIAIAEDGRELARVAMTLPEGEMAAATEIDLPLALRNDLASVRLADTQSAGAVSLIDARDRRALVGLVADAARPGDRLLNGAHYIREALEPHAEIIEDDLSTILEAGASVVILDDVGTIRRREIELLTAWIEKGGVLIRFAGPILADMAQDRTPPLLPVELRGGGRAFGGALTWETPQTLDPFPGDSPFAGIAVPDDTLIRRQVLAEPGGATTERSWARLKDGTPLVTGTRLGDGAVAMFHVTATPQWSDLPLSVVFVDMLRRLIFLSALGPEASEISAETRMAPLRLLDGSGRFRRAADADIGLTASEIAEPASPLRPPGYYGSPDAPLALNVIRAGTQYAPLAIPGVSPSPYVSVPPTQLAPPLFAVAMALLLIDALVILIISGWLRLRRPAQTAAVALAAFAIMGAPGNDLRAQPLDTPLEQQAIDAALSTRLAFVRTGDPALDRLSAQALTGLSRELYRRTALEPAPPAGVNPETDDLSVYPFLYWPIAAGAETPSEDALANIENFMRLGGLILFDTRDDERAVGVGSTPESEALQRVLGQLNIPPLTPVTSEHVLTRSFYLLPEGLYGRLRNNPVWVASDAGVANDGVTPVIIGGRDWAGAWAVDSFGRPVRPMGAGGDRAREFAFRAGINIVMVAFTGNYKSDQVHTPVLLERLGR